MSRYIQAAHEIPVLPAVVAISAGGEADGPGMAERGRETAFVVKLRDCGTRMWGNQIEVLASSERDAAELVSGERLRGGTGDRSNLRARVWKLPFGSVPDHHFFAEPASSN